MKNETTPRGRLDDGRPLIVFFCSSDGEKVPLEIASTATVTQLRVC